MTFAQARERLDKIAGKRYHSMEFKLTTYQKNIRQTSVGVYIDGYSHYEGDTWNEAFDKLDKAMNSQKYIEEIPYNLNDGYQNESETISDS